MTTEVIGIRIPKKLKEELRERNIDYTEGVRVCLERMVMEKKSRKFLRGLTGTGKSFIKKQV